ncbi:MAG: DUF1499 domain-containing protein [Rhizomicrobium sp.]|jgi:hypothetical protein
MGFMNIVGRLAFAAFVISLVVGMVAAFGTRLDVFDYWTGVYAIFPFCLYAGGAGLVLGAVWALAALLYNDSTASNYAVAGLLGSLAVMAVPLYTMYLLWIVHAIPPIHDISTDTEHPPAFVALLKERAGAPNPPDYDGPILARTYDGKERSTAQLQKLYYSDLKPLGLLGTTPDGVYQRALRAAAAMGWHIVADAETKDGGRIEATKTSLFFGFTEDIVIRVTRSGMGCHLDIRSKSRVGTTDFGINAANIRSYVKTFANTG